VQQERAHDKGITRVRGAANNGPGTTNLGGGLRRNAARRVRTRHHLKRPVALATAIEVHADSHKAREKLDRRLDENRSFLL
jgi:hypothetical protein